MGVSELSAKISRRIKHLDLDNAIAKWVIECQHLNMHISYDLIKLKAIDFATKMEVDNPPKFSNGWMQKFLKRDGFKKTTFREWCC